MKRKRPPEELNIFGALEYKMSFPELFDEDENSIEREKKGFECCGMYVTGTTKAEFIKLLEDVGWMKL